MKRLLVAVGIIIGSFVLGGSQAVTPLSDALRAQLKAARFDLVTAVRGLPLGVRDELQKLFGTGTLDIADPGGEFRGTGVAANPRAPSRRLVSAACSVNHCLVYYERGGAELTWRVALFYWTPAWTKLEWGALAPGGLKTIAAVREAVLSGSLKSPATVW